MSPRLPYTCRSRCPDASTTHQGEAQRHGVLVGADCVGIERIVVLLLFQSVQLDAHVVVAIRHPIELTRPSLPFNINVLLR